MATAGEVLSMLIPTGGWVSRGEDYEGVEFIDCKTITKKQFTDGFAQYDAWKAKQNEAQATAKAAILDRIGLTADELKTILG